MTVPHRTLVVALLAGALLGGACSHPRTEVPAVVTPAAPRLGDEASGGPTQLVLVTTPGWDSTAGTLQRYARESARSPWRPVGARVPVMVGRSGLAWGANEAADDPAAPRKREGDGRAPAGRFPLDTVFGFAPAASWVRLPYFPLGATSECVDDGASRYYNTIVDRNRQPTVDWTSSERMRLIDQYKLGVVVGYNATPPVPGRGSCIFLHIWAGPGKPTSGCTAMPEHDLTEIVLWLDRARRPMLVQLPAAPYARRRESWGLP
jgi:L,D-peptidoglycan transpeptidase YkuD (ErfK/YbiS/YcfS/YnhG family)